MDNIEDNELYDSLGKIANNLDIVLAAREKCRNNTNPINPFFSRRC